MWGGESLMRASVWLLVRRFRKGGVSGCLGREVSGLSFAYLRGVCWWIFLWVGMREYVVVGARVVLCRGCSPSGVGEVMY